jgi:hypothetical protein
MGQIRLLLEQARPAFAEPHPYPGLGDLCALRQLLSLLYIRVLHAFQGFLQPVQKLRSEHPAAAPTKSRLTLAGEPFACIAL